MRYILIYREGSGEAVQWDHDSFAAQSSALAKAWALIATGCAGEVRIEDDYRHIVKTDPDIRRQYEGARHQESPW